MVERDCEVRFVEDELSDEDLAAVAGGDDKNRGDFNQNDVDQDQDFDNDARIMETGPGNLRGGDIDQTNFGQQCGVCGGGNFFGGEKNRKKY